MQKKTEAEKTVIGYCKDIGSGKILSGLYVKKAVNRFLSDLKKANGADFEYFMDWSEAEKFLAFSRLLIIDNKPLTLLPWQIFIHANLICWRHKDRPTKRRFRSGAIFVPRKNGKTHGILLPLSIYFLMSKPGSQCFYLEKDERQAAHFFAGFQHILKNSPAFEGAFKYTKQYLEYGNGRLSFFGSDTVGLDGYGVDFSAVDEFHQFYSNAALTAMRFGGRAKENTLCIVISTAGNDISLPCYNEDEKCRKILNNVLTDETYFAVIFSCDEGDDWKTETAFLKANPSVDTIIERSALRADLQSAIGQVSQQADFKSKTLGIWQSGVSGWINMQKWDTPKRNKSIDVCSLKGKQCWAALDLSSTSDFTAYTKCFRENGDYLLLHKFWIPESTLAEKYRVENINIKEWQEKKMLVATPGNTVDYQYLLKELEKDYAEYQILELAYDSWGVGRILDSISETMPNTNIVAFPQSLSKMSGPSKEYERHILNDKIIDGNPIILWMLGNAEIKPDINGNYKPFKRGGASSNNRIDGVITSIMSISRCTANESTAVTESLTVEQVAGLF